METSVVKATWLVGREGCGGKGTRRELKKRTRLEKLELYSQLTAMRLETVLIPRVCRPGGGRLGGTIC